jgi:hypothetical protein
MAAALANGAASIPATQSWTDIASSQACCCGIEAQPPITRFAKNPELNFRSRSGKAFFTLTVRLRRNMWAATYPLNKYVRDPRFGSSLNF